MSSGGSCHYCRAYVCRCEPDKGESQVTLAELLALPDETLDRLAAELVMGWTAYKWAGINGWKDKIDQWKGVYHPTCYISDAQQLYGPIDERGLMDQFAYDLIEILSDGRQFSGVEMEVALLTASPRKITAAAIKTMEANHGKA